MIASPLLRLLVLSLCALLVFSQAQLDIGDSDLTEVGTGGQGFLDLLSRARPQFLKLQGGVSKRTQYSASDFTSAKRRPKTAKCMADFWKGRGLVNC